LSSNVAVNPADNELEFVVQDPFSYKPGQSVRSQSKTVGDMQFRLLVFPAGTVTGALATKGSHVSAFVEPCAEELPANWEYKSVQYRIAALNVKNLSQSIVKVDTFSFSANPNHDRGWHDLVPTRALKDPQAGWCRPDGSICIRATVVSTPVLTLKA
jgi:hypothetical protein